jgi:hypothetical protein
MLKIVGTLVTLVLVLGTGSFAQAQTGEKVLDTLGDLLRGATGATGQQVQGYVVAMHDADMVMQTKDGRIVTISTTDVDRSELGRLHPGKAVRVTLKRGTDQAMVASAVEPLSGDQRSFRTASGVVDAVSGDRAQIRTFDGVITADLAKFVGTKPSLRSGDQVMVTYEVNGPTRTAVWIDSQPTVGAASPNTSLPPGTAGGGYERIHGFVQSVGLGTLTVKADDGRTLTVDIGSTRGNASDVRPGDLVNLVGRSSGDRFVAEMVQRQ